MSSGTGWYPIAASTDLAYRTTFHAQIMGREFVAWRADDDTVNLWENRCLHRGVRLTLGLNDGAELTCRYHGWRYANRTAGCTYIPAHPADAPARVICNTTYPVAERYGLVWGSAEARDDAPPTVDALEAGAAFVLRPIPVDAPPAMVLDALADHRFLHSNAIDPRPGAGGDWRDFRSDAASWPVEVIDRADLRLTLRASAGADSTTLVVWVQPVDAHRSVIRGVLDATPSEDRRIDVLRHHNDRLSRLRDAVETSIAGHDLPDPIRVDIAPVATELAAMPESAGPSSTIRVQVTRKWQTAEDVAALELTALDGQLPTFQPGSHIDVHLPNGLVRQYSLTNGPGELASYRIGVKLEAESRGGSSLIHSSLREGDLLAISPPRNGFTLRRDSERTVLVAGGIGITPLLAMAQSLDRNGLEYELHSFVRGTDHCAFGEVTARLGRAPTLHVGLSPGETRAALADLLGDHTESAQVYVCGPGPMIETLIEVADELGWPDSAVHFEYFANPTDVDDSATFEVALARSMKTFTVASGESLLDALRDHGVAIPSSCEQGACGTCVVPVVEGEVLHQDVCLTRAERSAGDRIATCVSRASSDRLVLDL